jgi:DNA helicase INO80
VREAEQNQKKLEFLLKQTEIFSQHFGKKLGLQQPLGVDSEDSASECLDVVSHPINELSAHEEGIRAAQRATKTERFKRDAAEATSKVIEDGLKRKQQFDSETNELKIKAGGRGGDTDGSARAEVMDLNHPSTMPSNELQHKEPSSFAGKLKSYQVKGLNWLVNLFEQGINGILADEMGLGKTIQTICFLAHLAEVQDIWGPFLVVAPSSTLHQWQQEIKKFAPKLNVLPYWGGQNERKVT